MDTHLSIALHKKGNLMLIIGITAAKTRAGENLIDGAAALLIDGRMGCAIAEERISRIKHDSGSLASLNYVLNATNTRLSDVDLIVVSSCLEKPCVPSNQIVISSNGVTLSDLGVSPSKIAICDHHQSHALTAGILGNGKRLVIVGDGAGNAIGNETTESAEFTVMQPDGTITGVQRRQAYWRNRLMKQSQFIVTANSICKLHSDFAPMESTGMGDIYWYFTRLIGFGSYSNAGKTMGLAPFGRLIPGLRLFNLDDFTGEIHGLIPQGFLNPGMTASAFLGKHGIKVSERLKGEEVREIDRNLALLVQKEFERALLHQVNYWSTHTGIRDIGLAGGNALNSVANGVLADAGYDVYVPSAPGDTGQALGNAIHGAMLLGEKLDSASLTIPYTGRSYAFVPAEAERVGLKVVRMDQRQVVPNTARFLAGRYFVGWFQGGSEYGPRALGHRSILAAPFKKEDKDRLNADVKFREAFRPFGPSVPVEDATSWFDVKVPSPYMSFVAPVSASGLDAVTHIDGTARYHTVDAHTEPKYHSLLKAFGELTGCPVLLNTSFNLAGTPIVETPQDAIEVMKHSKLDLLILEDYLVYRDGVPVENFLLTP
jgi:carbamoyltransferase